MFLSDKSKQLRYRVISLFVCTAVGFTTTGAIKVKADDPTQFLKGDSSAEFILNNIDYTDIRGTQVWSAPAIYETGALNIMKGYGSQYFAKDDNVSREQALAIAFRLAGREADAKQAAADLDAARTNKLSDPFLYWSLGYLKIAADDGIISEQEFQDAVDSNGRLGFNGQAPAQRQEMAYWIAMALKLPPKYDEQVILNNYNDWKQCDPDKIAYIEATLNNRIMNGDGYGSFLPRAALTREQAAQIVKNAESFILPAMKLTKKTGSIENMQPAVKVENGVKLYSADFYIRNIDGTLSLINSGFSANSWNNSNNELNGNPGDPNNSGLVVYKDGTVGGAGLLASGDRIEYIYDESGVVKYINVVSSSLNTQYFLGQLKNLDTKTFQISFNAFFGSESPDIDLSQQYASPVSSGVKQTFSYSRDAHFIIDGINVDPSKLNKEDFIIVTVVSDTVTKVQKYNPVYRHGNTGVINGTVQDNNPSLGYITLYGQDGTGVGVNPITSDILRNYDYASVNGVEVYRDNAEAQPGDIKPGDTVFLKLNSAGKVTQISAASNYTIRYGIVMSVSDSSLSVEYDDKTQQTIQANDDTRWFGADGSYGSENIKNGDSVVLTLNASPAGTLAVEVRGSNIFSQVNNTYKASLENYLGDTNSLYISDVKTFSNNSFDWISDKGIKKLKVSDSCKVYIDGVKVSIGSLSDTEKLSTVYVVTKSNFGDDEKAFIIAVNTQQTLNMPIYSDSLLKMDTINDTVTLQNNQINLPFRDETIIIKDGRIVNFNSLKADDALSVATGYYKGANGNYAAIIIAGERVDNDYFEVYRGRISDINDGTNFTLKSYSQLKDYVFNFYNTEKTFDLTSKTRLVGDAGLISLRSFTGSGTNSYIGDTVYVIAKNGEALYISTAPYSNMYSFKAEVAGVSSSALQLKAGRIFNPSTYEWKETSLTSTALLSNTIIIKGDKIIKPTELKKGDQIKLFKEGNTATGNAYIVVVEE